MIVAFAAAPGTTAVDTDGANSLFAVSVVTQMRQPGLEIEQIFINARLAVSQATQGSQVPWFVDQLTPELYLFPAPTPPTAGAWNTAAPGGRDRNASHLHACHRRSPAAGPEAGEFTRGAGGDGRGRCLHCRARCRSA